MCTKKALGIVLSDWTDEEDDIVGGVEWDAKVNGGEENSVVYIGDMLDLENTMEYGKGRQGVTSQPPVVTTSGSMVKTGHCGQYIPCAGSQSPSYVQAPRNIHQVDNCTAVCLWHCHCCVLVGYGYQNTLYISFHV
jgi:hypothetical protein